LAIISLVALIIIQIYLILSVMEKTKSNELFEQKEAIKKSKRLSTLKD